MARRKYSIDKKKTDRWLKEGRGKGHGANYKPWLTVRDVPSSGLSSRIKGLTTGRNHHLLSELESNAFYIYDWTFRIKDIREQYPLPLESTLEIANRLGIKHPIDVESKDPRVMTTDFLLDVELNGSIQLIARTAKYESDLNSPKKANRIMELFEVERTYWKEKGIDWVTYPQQRCHC